MGPLQQLSLLIVTSLFQFGLKGSLFLQVASLATSALLVAQASQQILWSGVSWENLIEAQQRLLLSHTTLLVRAALWRCGPLPPAQVAEKDSGSATNGRELLKYCLLLLLRPSKPLPLPSSPAKLCLTRPFRRRGSCVVAFMAGTATHADVVFEGELPWLLRNTAGALLCWTASTTGSCSLPSDRSAPWF